MKYTFTNISRSTLKSITELGQVVENFKKKILQNISYCLKGLEASPRSFFIFLKPLLISNESKTCINTYFLRSWEKNLAKNHIPKKRLKFNFQIQAIIKK